MSIPSVDRNLTQQLSDLKSVLGWSFALGIILNIFGFTSPLFMMIVMDSVVPSQDANTLAFLLAFGCIAFGILSIADILRRMLHLKVANWLEMKLTNSVIEKSQLEGDARVKSIGDVKQISNFVRSGSTTIIDIPLSIIAFMVLWLVHPAFLAIALITAVILLSLSYLSMALNGRLHQEAFEIRKRALSKFDSLNSANVLARTMGIFDNLGSQFKDNLFESLVCDSKSSLRTEMISGLSRALRQCAQIVSLGAGALLVMNGSLSSGAMIAGYIIIAKALQPIEQISYGWTSIMTAKSSYTRLKKLDLTLHASESNEQIIPKHISPLLQVNNISVPRSRGAEPVLDRICFEAKPGECIAILGPSNAGKSTLAELIAGVRTAPIGNISIDGIPYNQISEFEKSKLIGFAPQTDQFLLGTIAQNIARFETDASKNDVLKAVTRVDAEESVRQLSDGFDTSLAISTEVVSSGIAKRLNIARAIFGEPQLIVLDEPGASLDERGEKSLINLIGELKRHGHTIILIAQRAGLLSVADKLMCLENGRLRDFGERAEVLSRLSLNRSQIDLNLNLDEISRLARWLDVQLARSDDIAIRARAESALIEVFNIIRAHPDSNTETKHSIVINYEEFGIGFDIYCNGFDSLGLSKNHHEPPPKPSIKDVTNLSVYELSKTILFSMVTDAYEHHDDNDRLVISLKFERKLSNNNLNLQEKFAI